MRVLVFQTAFLGDAVLSIPLLKAIKQIDQDIYLGFVCRKGVGEIFRRSGIVDECIEVDKKNSASLKEAFQKTKEFKAETIVSCHRSFRTAWWVWRLGAAKRVGYADFWTWFAYNEKIRRISQLHDVIRQLSLIEGLGVRLGDVPEEVLNLQVPVEANSLYESLKGAVALAPGSQWETKRWTLEGFIGVGRKLESQGFKVAIVGAPNEKEICQKLADALKNPANLCGQTNIFGLAQALKETRLLICNDSGAMHVAGAVGTPVVGIFGPTVPAQGYSPWQEKATVVEAELDCRPCGKHGHHTCPIGTHDCMKKVEAAYVLRAAKPFLSPS